MDKIFNKDYKNLYKKYKKKYLGLKKKLNFNQKGGNIYGKLTFYSQLFIDNQIKALYDTKNMLLTGDARLVGVEGQLEKLNLDFTFDKWQVWENVFMKTKIDFGFDPTSSNKSIYQSDEYKLFPTEEFINSDFIRNLVNYYYTQFFDEIWCDNIRPDLEERLNNEIVFIEKLELPRNSKICIVGDIHSSLHSLLSTIFKIRYDYFEDKESLILKPNRYLIFLGDIVDRGPYSMELLVLILGLKYNNFEQVFIINGNHEEYPTYETIPEEKDSDGNLIYPGRYGLEEEFEEQYSKDLPESEKHFIKGSPIGFIFAMLPSCIYLKVGDKYYHFSHGAFDPEFAGIEVDDYSIQLKGGSRRSRASRTFTEEDIIKIQKSIDENQIKQIEETKIEETKIEETKERPKKINKLKKFLDSESKFCLVKIESYDDTGNNYKWGDFDDTVNWARTSGRNSSGEDTIKEFGVEITKKYIEENNIVCLITGHQDYFPLSLLLDDNQISSKNYLRRQEEYNLFTIDYKKMYDSEESQEYKINFDQPNNDFLVLITSTATISRNMNEDQIHLELII